MASNNSAIILAAGSGTRFKSSTPKVLHDFLGKPMLKWSVDAALNAGVEAVCVVVSPGIRDQVEAVLQESYAEQQVTIAVQDSHPGTAGAVRAALEKPEVRNSKHTVILCGDTPLVQAETVQNVLQGHIQEQSNATVVSMKLDQPGSYGRIVRESTGAVHRIVEFADADEAERAIQEVNTGVWAFTTVWLMQSIEKIEPTNAQGEWYLTDLLELAAQDKSAAAICSPQASDFQGINTRGQFKTAWAVGQERILQQHMDRGVSFLGSNHLVECNVQIGQDTIVEAGVQLRGSTTIGTDCKIEANSYLVNASIDDECTIHPMCHLDSCTIGQRATIGPFARIRPDSQLAQDTKVGNFVETKKTKLGKGSKINHLAYIGDAVIGEQANIGAGTITCNYDGFNKSVTEIGDRVFVGSNSTLVAPVTLESDSYVGAGSTVTKSVPTDALGIARADQKNIEKLGARIRAKKQHIKENKS